MSRVLIHVGPLAEANGSIGGVGFYLAELATALARRHRSIVLAQKTDTISVPNVVVRHVFTPGAFAFRDVDRALPTESSMIHVQYETSLFGSPLASLQLPYWLRKWRRRGHRTVVTMHHVLQPTFDVVQMRLWRPRTWYDPLIPPVLRSLQRRIVAAADLAIVHEQSQRNVFRTSNIEVVPLFIPNRPSRSLGTPGDELRLVFFGFLAPYKGVLELARAVANGSGRGRRITLEIVGGAHPRLSDAPEYQSFIRELEALAQANDSIRLRGFLSDEDADAAIAASDLVVLPYQGVIGASAALARAAALGVGFAISTSLATALDFDRSVLTFQTDDVGIAKFLNDVTHRDIVQARASSQAYASSRSLTQVAKSLGDVYERLGR